MALYHCSPFELIWTDDLRPLEALMDRLTQDPRSRWRALTNGDDSWWEYNETNRRLDDVLDMLKVLNHTVTQVNSPKKVREPEPVPRPGTKPKGGQPLSLDDVPNFF